MSQLIITVTDNGEKHGCKMSLTFTPGCEPKTFDKLQGAVMVNIEQLLNSAVQTYFPTLKK